jgi:hypothetical protein
MPSPSDKSFATISIASLVFVLSICSKERPLICASLHSDDSEASAARAIRNNSKVKKRRAKDTLENIDNEEVQ